MFMKYEHLFQFLHKNLIQAKNIESSYMFGEAPAYFSHVYVRSSIMTIFLSSEEVLNY